MATCTLFNTVSTSREKGIMMATLYKSNNCASFKCRINVHRWFSYILKNTRVD